MCRGGPCQVSDTHGTGLYKWTGLLRWNAHSRVTIGWPHTIFFKVTMTGTWNHVGQTGIIQWYHWDSNCVQDPSAYTGPPATIRYVLQATLCVRYFYLNQYKLHLPLHVCVHIFFVVLILWFCDNNFFVVIGLVHSPIRLTPSRSTLMKDSFHFDW